MSNKEELDRIEDLHKESFQYALNRLEQANRQVEYTIELLKEAHDPNYLRRIENLQRSMGYLTEVVNDTTVYAAMICGIQKAKSTLEEGEK